MVLLHGIDLERLGQDARLEAQYRLPDRALRSLEVERGSRLAGKAGRP